MLGGVKNGNKNGMWGYKIIGVLMSTIIMPDKAKEETGRMRAVSV
jgi:hypothetical protein